MTPPEQSLSRRVLHHGTKWLERDAAVLVLFAIVAAGMTYPMVRVMSQLLPAPTASQADIFVTLWQRWWMEKVLLKGFSPNFTPYLYYPVGLDITFQPHRWTAIGTWIPLVRLFGDIAGYNLTALLGLIASAYTAYLLILYLTNRRLAAWIGGAFFAFYSAHLVDALEQPNSGSIQWIPLFMLVLIIGLRRIRDSADRQQRLTRPVALSMVLAGLALSLNGYVSIKVWMMAGMLGGLYVMGTALTSGLWKRPVFWQAVGILSLVSVLLILPVVLPFVRVSWLGTAIAQKSGLSGGIDLAAFIKPGSNLPPLVSPPLARLLGINWEQYSSSSAYLGLSTLALVIAAAISLWKRQRDQLMWLALALIFATLSLGTTLMIDGQKLPHVWLPYQSLENIVFFKMVRKPHRFILAFVLPWAVLTGYGVAAMTERLGSRPRLAVVIGVLLGCLMLYEISIVPIRIQGVPLPSFYQRLATSDSSGAIIDLPLDQGLDSYKWYTYLQSVHNRPIVVGKVARMPPGYDRYIQANPLLRAWQEGDALVCSYDMAAALGVLQEDGFEFIIVHQTATPSDELDRLAAYLATIQPVYQKDGILVYRVEDLLSHPPCPPAG